MALPILVKGNTLGERQQELNKKVKNCATANFAFEKIKNETEQTEIDRLFKIDLAAMYKNIDYIIEALKSNDGLFISRALKCGWLYDDDLSNIVNPIYLEHNLFSSMSARMQKKILTKISIYVTNEKRNEDFYSYCMDVKNWPNIAKKFAKSTSVEFKKCLIENKLYQLQSFSLSKIDSAAKKKSYVVECIVGKDITLAECFLERCGYAYEALYLLRKFYFIDPNRYQLWVNKYYCKISKTLGLRISNDIMKKYKKEVIKNIRIYFDLLRRSALIKFTTTEDAKQCLISLLPESNYEFWKSNFYYNYKLFFDKISSKDDRYYFLKNIYVEKYPGYEFEMNESFLRHNFQDLMPVEDAEVWALRHVEASSETSIKDRNYFWYKYIRFDKAIEPIKQYVLITPEDDKRAEAVLILVESAKNLSDVEKLLNYYYERHVNEERERKISFVEKVMNTHNIFEFNENCWRAFQKILYSLEVYNPTRNCYKNIFFLKATLLYHIANNIEITDALTELLIDENILYFHDYHLEEKLNDEKKKRVYQFMIEIYKNKLKKYENVEYNNSNERKISDLLYYPTYLQNNLLFINEELPTHSKLMKSKTKYLSRMEKAQKTSLRQDDLLKTLKSDATQLVDMWPKVKHGIENEKTFKFNTFLSKLRVYFKDGIAQDYVNFFNQCLSSEGRKRLIFKSVYGIFHLADVQYKIKFVKNYFSFYSNTDHREIRRRLCIQEGIHRYAPHAKPPVPVPKSQQHMAAYYARFSRPLFKKLVANLDSTEYMQLIEPLLVSPVSSQTYAVEVAFKRFDFKDLQPFVKELWSKSNNITLRKTIYFSIFNKIAQGGVSEQQRKDGAEFFKCLLEVMEGLHQDDHVDVLKHVAGCERHNYSSNYSSCRKKNKRIPEPDMIGEFLPAYLETAWKVISNFRNSPSNVELKASLLKKLSSQIYLIDETLLRALIDEHFDTIFNKNGIAVLFGPPTPTSQLDYNIFQAKQSLALVLMTCERFSIEIRIELAKFVLRNCLKRWDDSQNIGPHQISYMKSYCHDFIRDLTEKTNGRETQILEYLLSELRNSLPLHEVYMEVWKLRLKIITNGTNEFGDKSSEDAFCEQVCLLVTEFIAEQIFYVSFLDEIYELLFNHMKSHHFNVYNVSVKVGLKLIECGKFETALLAARLIPDVKNINYTFDLKSECNILLRKLETYDNFEIKYVLSNIREDWEKDYLEL